MTDLLRVAVSSSPGAPGRVPATDVPASDITIACDRTTTLVGDVAELIGFARGPLLIDGRAFPGTAILAETTIADGSVVANPADGVRPDLDETGPPLVTIRTLAGPHGGRSQVLPAGRFDLSAHSPVWLVAAQGPTKATRVLVEIDLETVAVAPGAEPVVLNGRLVDGVVVVPRAESIVVNLGGTRFSIEPYEARLTKRAPLEGAVHRIPRVATPAPEHAYTTTEMPKPPLEVPPLSWIAMLAPIPAAAILAMAIGSKNMLYFAALSPLAMIARWYDGKRRAGKQRKQYEAAVVAARADALQQILAGRKVASAHANAGNPGPDGVVARALENDPRLWERRPGHEDFGVVTIAIGEQAWRFEATVPSPVQDLVDSVSHLDSVPITVDLKKGSVGVVGSRAQALGVARALMVELAVLSGPADIPLALVGTERNSDRMRQ